MLDELKNLNIDTCSGSELKVLIRQTLPVVMTFVKASQKLLDENNPEDSPCQNCKQAETCKEPCELLKNKLVPEHKGSKNLQCTYGNLIEAISNANDSDENGEILRKYDSGYLKEIDRVRSDDIFALYKNCIHLFSKTEWRVVTLRIEEGLRFKEIGRVLGIETSTASGTFYRAQNKMEQHYQKMRYVKKRKNT